MARWSEARGSARGAVTRRRELLGLLAAAALTAIVYFGAGLPGSGSDGLIAVGITLVVGVFIIPSGAFLWSALTYEIRHLRAQVDTLTVALEAVKTDVAEHSHDQPPAKPVAPPPPDRVIRLRKSGRGLLQKADRMRDQTPTTWGDMGSPGLWGDIDSWENDVDALFRGYDRPDLAEEWRKAVAVKQTGVSALNPMNPQRLHLNKDIDYLKKLLRQAEDDLV